MYVYISAAISLDGYIDNGGHERLMLSNEEDLDAVKTLRARYDAILVGAETIRRDNPSLVIRNEALRAERSKRKMSPDIIKVTVTSTGEIDPASRFFTEGHGRKIVIASTNISKEKLHSLSQVSEVAVAQTDITPETITAILENMGIKNLFIEGGSRILTMFLSSGRADYLRLAVAPFFVGDDNGKRFVGNADFTFNKDNRATLRQTYQIGDMAIAEYSLKASAKDIELTEETIRLAGLSPQSESAYSVGAVIVTVDGSTFTGYSRETSPHNHAEEEAIIKAETSGHSLKGATIYTSMEPCSTRKSKERSCSDLIIRSGMGKVVFAAKEPTNFVNCIGEQMLSNAGLKVVYLKELEPEALKKNSHILQ